MRDQGVGGREAGFPQVGRGGDTALCEPVPVGPAPGERVRRDRDPVPGVARRASRASGPRPVRPRPAVQGVRPAAPTCAAGRAVPARAAGASARARPARPMLRPVPVLPAHILRRRRVAATIGMALLTAVVVVLLGLLADVAAAARASSGEPDAVTGWSLTAVVGSSGEVAGVGSR